MRQGKRTGSSYSKAEIIVAVCFSKQHCPTAKGVNGQLIIF